MQSVCNLSARRWRVFIENSGDFLYLLSHEFKFYYLCFLMPSVCTYQAADLHIKRIKIQTRSRTNSDVMITIWFISGCHIITQLIDRNLVTEASVLKGVFWGSSTRQLNTIRQTKWRHKEAHLHNKIRRAEIVKKYSKNFRFPWVLCRTTSTKRKVHCLSLSFIFSGDQMAGRLSMLQLIIKLK